MQSSLEFQCSRRKSAADVTDDALIRNIKQGSEQAFSRLYNWHVQGLFNYGMHACNDSDLVKDCLQDLFVYVWDQRDDLRVATSVKSYLFRSFRNLLVKKILTRKKFSVRVINFIQHQFDFKLFAYDDVFTERVVSTFDNEQIIQRLTEDQAEAVFLKFRSRLSYHEVASVMDRNVATIYNLVSRAVEILRHRKRNISQRETIFGMCLK